MGAYTLAEVEAAARRVGIDGKTPALLAALQRDRGRVTFAGNARIEDRPYPDMAEGLKRLYVKLGSWRAVGEVIGKSKAYAWRVAHGDLTPSAEALSRYQAYEKGGKSEIASTPPPTDLEHQVFL